MLRRLAPGLAVVIALLLAGPAMADEPLTAGSASGDLVGADAPRPAVCQAIGLPAYFYPAGGGNDSTWNQAIAGSKMIIANAGNPGGPGAAVDANYAAVISKAKAAGVRVLGYVDTSYAAPTRSFPVLRNEIDLWDTFYGVRDIFFDQTPYDTSTATFEYLKQAADYVHSRGGYVVFNPGVVPPENQTALADTIVSFEGYASAYPSATFPSWMANYPPEKWWHLIHQAPAAELSSLPLLSRERLAGYVYITDRVMPNPWDGLGSYWSTEVEQVRATCPTPTTTTPTIAPNTSAASTTMAQGPADTVATSVLSDTAAAGEDVTS